MADGVEFKLPDIDDLVAKLDAVVFETKYKGGRFALRKAAQLIREKAKANALRLDDPATARSIAKNVAERWNGRLFKRTGDLGFRIGVLGGAKQYGDTKANRRSGRVGETYPTGGSSTNPGGDTFHWRFLEFGTSRQRAQPFLRPALENNIDAATSEFIQQYDKVLDRAIKKAAKKAAKANRS
ncbi:HK97-gp10 family putative phage morphogenesis protein [Halopseudomonas laoshanensis]|uniref:HK97-gp10 family putative phage morphogenesis protein n=1 Tax=Halopseudomonas laoshanensis TaxID=2268758 RepID=UPI0037357514